MGKIFGYEMTDGRVIDGDRASGECRIIGTSLKEPEENKERYAVTTTRIIENEGIRKRAGNGKNLSWELLNLRPIRKIHTRLSKHFRA